MYTGEIRGGNETRREDHAAMRTLTLWRVLGRLCRAAIMYNVSLGWSPLNSR